MTTKRRSPARKTKRRAASRKTTRRQATARTTSRRPQPKKSRLKLPPFLRRKRKPAAPPPKKTARPAAKAGPAPAPAVRPAGPPIQTGISLDRKLDIVGVLMAVTGLLTLLSLASASQGSVTGAWLGLVRSLFGWGGYLLPIALIGVGVWLVARNFERVPRPDIERLIGLSLLYANLLVWLHAFLLPFDRAHAFALAAAGMGGGYLGGWLWAVLYGGLGALGLAIALMAWFLVGLALALDLSVLELFRWVGPFKLRIQDTWDEYRAGRGGPRPPAVSSAPFQPEDTPPIPLAAVPEAPPTPLPPPELRGAALSAAPVAAAPEPREWVLPDVKSMLDAGAELAYNEESDKLRARLIEDTLASFGAPAKVVEINRGPSITQFGVEPAFIESRTGRTRVRVGKIASLADDLSLALAASRIRVQAPVPGKGYVGIEVPNEEIGMVALRDVIENAAFNRLKSNLRFALGKDVAGHAVAADLAAMPHLLVAGATGSGKSVCVNAIIACLLLHNTPATMRMIMVDPKRVELTGYNGIPHLLAPVVTEIDRVVGVLQWVTREMDNRYQKFADSGARNLPDYNQRMAAQGRSPMPYLVLIIDELADMMMVAPDQTERYVTRMAQLARATGIHLMISTQRPSVDVVTGLIKANFPARIAFAVASGTDSRVILDQPGAERLLGRGDMLFQAPDAPAPVRLQGVFVGDDELQRLVQYWRGFAGTTATAPLATSTPADAPPPDVPLKQMAIWEEMRQMEAEKSQDDMYPKAVDLIRRRGKASISMLQRGLRIGYTRAARLIDQMEEQGVIGPAAGGSNAREVLDYGDVTPPEGVGGGGEEGEPESKP
ncbi:MAG: DNA translocase FtsK 4TM domain-containing protein [Chloroflexi bacterium]|nr:DNA translocase FtsK 4TM domain-containing protein [Chloroflexota bacterium]